MLRSFRSLPPLKKRVDDNPIQYGDEDGMALQGFYPPEHKYLGWHVIPPGNKLKDGRRSFMAPVSHIHLLQDEVFSVISGEGIWHSRGSAPRRVKAGESLSIPKLLPHTFENVPGSSKPLVVEFNYNSSMRDMELRFFCNMLSYLDDCDRAKVPPSLFQLCVFLADCWMPVDLGIPGSKWVNLVMSTLFTYLCAAIGYFILGYQRSYPEYYEKDNFRSSKKSR